IRPSALETPQAATVAQTAPEPVASKAPAASSLDPEQMQQLTRSLTALLQTADQIAAGQDEMKRAIVKLASSVVEVLLRLPAPPPPPQPPRVSPRPYHRRRHGRRQHNRRCDRRNDQHRRACAALANKHRRGNAGTTSSSRAVETIRQLGNLQRNPSHLIALRSEPRPDLRRAAYTQRGISNLRFGFRFTVQLA